MDRRFLIYTCSTRPGSNSLELAQQAVVDMTPDQVQWVDLAKADLPPFTDLRPQAPGLTPAMNDIWTKTAAATDLVFATPIYWYALPAPAKLWLDHWSSMLDIAGLNFADTMREKTVWALTTRADPDPMVAQPVEEALRRTARWMNMHWGGALHAIADGVGEVRHSTAWEKARKFLTHPPVA